MYSFVWVTLDIFYSDVGAYSVKYVYFFFILEIGIQKVEIRRVNYTHYPLQKQWEYNIFKVLKSVDGNLLTSTYLYILGYLTM